MQDMQMLGLVGGDRVLKVSTLGTFSKAQSDIPEGLEMFMGAEREGLSDLGGCDITVRLETCPGALLTPLATAALPGLSVTAPPQRTPR